MPKRDLPRRTRSLPFARVYSLIKPRNGNVPAYVEDTKPSYFIRHLSTKNPLPCVTHNLRRDVAKILNGIKATNTLGNGIAAKSRGDEPLVSCIRKSRFRVPLFTPRRPLSRKTDYRRFTVDRESLVTRCVDDRDVSDSSTSNRNSTFSGKRGRTTSPRGKLVRATKFPRKQREERTRIRIRGFIPLGFSNFILNSSVCFSSVDHSSS